MSFFLGCLAWQSPSQQQQCDAGAQVVAAPVVGKLAQVGTDRTIGTVLGGVSGFGAYFGYKCTPRELYEWLAVGIPVQSLM